MSKHLVTFLLTLSIISGCASTSTSTQSDYANLPVSDSKLIDPKLKKLLRFAPRYPVQNAKRSLDGCATVEYVILPNNEVTDVRVVDSTSRYFADSAVQAVKSWEWASLPQGIISEPLKAQARFDFCLNKTDQPCSKTEPDYFCPGEEIIYVMGTRIRKADLMRR